MKHVKLFWNRKTKEIHNVLIVWMTDIKGQPGTQMLLFDNMVVYMNGKKTLENILMDYSENK